MSVVVRQATREDKPALFEFIRKAYGQDSARKIPDRWRWEFEENPEWKGSDLPVWIAVDGEKIVGQTCAMPFRLRFGGTTYSASWSVDTIVLPECQGQGIGTLLQRANAQANPIFMSLSMSKANRTVKSKIGSAPLPPATCYSRLLDCPASFVKDYLRFRTKNHRGASAAVRIACGYFGAHYLISGLARPVLFVRRTLAGLTLRPSAGFSLEVRQDFDASADELWLRAAPGFDAIAERNSGYLNWKFVRQPGLKYRIRYLRFNGALRGYLVLREPDPSEPDIGVVAELFALPDDEQAIAELVRGAIASFSGKTCAIEAATSHPAFQKAFARRFRRSKEAVPMFSSSVPGVEAAKAGAAVWFLGKGDHDWDQVHPVDRS